MGEVTQLIERARGGSREAFERIFELVCPERRQIAHRRLSRGARDGPREATALFNGCHGKFVHRESLTPADRSHFLACSAAVMRSIVVDTARQARIDARLAGVGERRDFGGMADAAIAAALGLSKRTVSRDRDKARRPPAHALRS